MKLLKIALTVMSIYFLITLTGSSITSCSKTITVHDTTIKNIHDTTIRNIHDTTIKHIHDTTTVIDSIWNITNGLVAWYNFNGGNLNDSSGHNNNIIFNNAIPTFDRLGNAGNAYLFDGTTPPLFRLERISPVCSPSRGAALRTDPGVSESFATTPSVFMCPAAG